MESGQYVLTAWSYGLAGFAYTALALHLWRAGHGRGAKQGAARWMQAAVVATALWGWVGLVDQFAGTVLFMRLGAFADLLAYSFWFLFLLRLLLPAAGGKPVAAISWLGAVAALAVLAAAVLQLLVSFRAGSIDERSSPVLLSWMVLSVLALVLVEQLLRNVQDDALWNVKPLCLGLAGAFLFDLYLFSTAVLFNRLDVDALRIRGMVHAMMAPLLMLSTLRGKDWMVTLRISRTAAFHSATLLLAGAYLLFISGVGYYVRMFGGEWGRALQLGLVFLAVLVLVMLALSGSVRARLRVLLGKHFFRYRYDYRDEWLRFTQTLSAQGAAQQMGQQVIRGLADMLESPGGALWIRNASDGAYRQGSRWNMAQSDEPEPDAAPLCQFIKRTGWVINLDEYRSIPHRYDGLSLPGWLRELPRAWLIVPLNVGDEMIGFVILASARTRVDVNWEVNDLLKTAGRQAASFLAQMQATEALLEARKFDAFNRMSAFVVHDLKNIVTQLSLMMKNAKRLHANPEFQQDMLMTIENSLEKMRQLMLQLREGATPPGTALGVDLGRVAQRIEASVAQRGRKLELGIAERVFARGHEERLERVIGHMVQNAFDATDAEGRVWLKVDRHGSQVRVEVGDTGHGMSPEFVRDELFKPFRSTKKAGMGIGAYESFQYVQELGGTVSVKSEPAVGTEITLMLPRFEAQGDSELLALKTT